MTRRSSLPKITAADLRDDHADEARVARVWARLEEGLPDLSARPRRKVSMAVTLLAASLGLFGAGLLTGKLLTPRQPSALTATPSHDALATDVLAAGSNERTFPLPNGGEITLQPGSTVEVERDGEHVTLRLVQGEAKLDAATAHATASLQIVAGDATLNPQAGSSLRVKRNPEDLDVTVSNGLVGVVSPAGSQRLEQGQRLEKVPIHSIVASAPSTSPRTRLSMAPHRGPNDVTPIPEPAAVAQPEWYSAWGSGDRDRAYDLLKQSPGGIEGAISAAASASELANIADVAKGHADQAGVMHAYERILSSFASTQYAIVAKAALSEMLCNQMRGEESAGHKDKAARLASDYASKYPDGACKEDAARLAQDVGGDAGAAAPNGSASAAPSVTPASKPGDAPRPSDKPAP